MKKFYLVLLLLFTAPVVSREIRWELNDLPESVDNIDWRSLDRWYLLNQCFSTLVRYGGHYKLKPILAKKWIVSNDRKKIKFFLRETNKFSNGDLITAVDVIFSLKRYLLRQKGTNLFKQRIVDADKLKSLSSNIKGLELKNTFEFDINLTEPFENIWSYLSFPTSGGIVKSGSVDKKNYKLKQKIYSGDFQVLSESKKEIILIPNEYKKNKTNLKKVYVWKNESSNSRLENFKNGKTNFYARFDYLNYKDKRYLNLEKKVVNDVLDFPKHRVSFLFLNPLKYQNSIIRKNIAYLLEKGKKTNLKNMKELSLSNDFFPVGSPGYISFERNSDSLVKMKKEKTIRILIENGLGVDQYKHLLSTKLKEMYENVEFISLSKKEISKNISKGTFDAVFTSLGYPKADHEYAIYLYFIDSPSYIKLENKKISNLFNLSSKTNDIILKSKYMKEISRLILKDNYILPLFHSSIKHYTRDKMKFRKKLSGLDDLHLINIYEEN